MFRPKTLGKTVIVAAIAVIALLATSAHGATLLTMKSHQDAFEIQGQSQPAQDNTVQIWLGDGMISRDDGNSRVISDGEKLYLVDHGAKTYNVLDLPVNLAELLPEEMRGQLTEMRKVASISAEVAPVEETREVGDWNAKRYDVTLSSGMGLAVEQVIWASPDVEVDASVYNELTRALASLQPGGGDWVSQLSAIDGFPVLRETTMKIGPDASVLTTEELVSVEEKEAPADTFKPPTDYEMKEFSFGGP